MEPGLLSTERNVLTSTTMELGKRLRSSAQAGHGVPPRPTPPGTPTRPTPTVGLGTTVELIACQ